MTITERLSEAFAELDAAEATARAAMQKVLTLVDEYSRENGYRITLAPQMARHMIEGRMERTLGRVA